MRQLYKIGDGYRTHQQRVFTDAQVIKFAKPRDENDLRDRSFRNGNFQGNTTASEVVTVIEPARQSAAANGSSR
jgi:hypothetical protein